MRTRKIYVLPVQVKTEVTLRAVINYAKNGKEQSYRVDPQFARTHNSESKSQDIFIINAAPSINYFLKTQEKNKIKALFSKFRS